MLEQRLIDNANTKNSRGLLGTISVLAVHDARLVGMDFQTALVKAIGDPFHDVLRLATAAAMQQPIVSVTAEPNAWHLASDPCIERIVQKQVGQHRTHNTTLRGA